MLRCNQSSLVRNLNGRWYAISLRTMLKPEKRIQRCKSVFLGTTPIRRVVCNQSSNNAKTREYSAAIYAKTLKANTALQSVFLGTNSKRAVVCNQSSNYANTLKANTALQSVFLGTKPKRTVVCNQSSTMLKP